MTPPPRFTAVSPADPNGAEGALPPAEPLLTGDGELAGEPATPTAARSPNPDPHAGHGQQGAAAPAEAAVYTCPMHPEVSEQEPGSCPVCGATLVEVHGHAQEARP